MSFNVLLYEFKHDLNQYLQSLDTPLKQLNLAKLIEFNRQSALKTMPYFGQELFQKAQTKGPLSEPNYQQALARIQTATRAEGIDQLITNHRLDALIAPTGGIPWTIDLYNGDYYRGGFSTYPAVAGYPHITVPMGSLFGLPIGLSFTGSDLSESKLLALARAFQISHFSPHPFKAAPVKKLFGNYKNEIVKYFLYLKSMIYNIIDF